MKQEEVEEENKGKEGEEEEEEETSNHLWKAACTDRPPPLIVSLGSIRRPAG